MTSSSATSRWQAFGVCVAVAALTILDLTKINVGLPSIERALGGGSTELQLIVAGYALAFGLVLVPAGRLGDVHSRKALFALGLTVFTGASLLCAIAPTIEILVIGRLIQGVAAGIHMPQVLGLIQQLFQGAERGKAFGLFGAIIGLSTAFAPTLGGFLVGIGGEDFGWRLLFWMNVPLGIAALLFAMRLLPGGQSHESGDRSLDLPGILLLGVATFSLMLPFVLTSGGADDDPARWWWLALFVVAAAAFVLWERRYLASGRTPVVNFGLFRLGSFRNGVFITTLYFAAIPPVFLITTLFLLNGVGISPVAAGMVTIPFALISAVTSWLGGRLVSRYGPKVVLTGVVLVVLGFGGAIPVVLVSPADAAPWIITAFAGLAGAGGGFVMSANQTLMLSEVPVVNGGVAGSVGQVGQRAGTAVGVAAAVSTYYATLNREVGIETDIAAYTHAYAFATVVSVGVLLVAVVFAVLDVRRRPTGLIRD